MALRPFAADDFDAAWALGQDPSSARWVPPPPAGDGPAMAAQLEAWRLAGDMLYLVIADAASGAFLGEVTLVIGEHEVGELGCGLAPAARGRGAATHALALLAHWALDTLGLGRVQVLVSPENPPALRLALAAGFRREGLLRAYWPGDGRRVDAVMLSMLPLDARVALPARATSPEA